MLKPRKRFKDDEDGAATVEFVIIFSFLITIVLSIFETGWLMTKQMMLDRGLDIATRDIRLGLSTSQTVDDIKTTICDRSLIFRNCMNEINIEIDTLSPASAFPQNAATCNDRGPDPNPVAAFRPTNDQPLEIKFIRACVLIDPIFPGIGVGLQMQRDSGGNGYQMVSFTAFVNEP